MQGQQPARNSGTAMDPSAQAATTMQGEQQYIRPMETVKQSADGPDNHNAPPSLTCIIRGNFLIKSQANCTM